MANQRFSIGQNNTLPAIREQLVDDSGDPVNLADCTAAFRMIDEDDVVKIDNQVATIIDEDKGIVEYAWQSGDTDTAGDFVRRWVVTTSEGTFDVPNFIDGYPVRVRAT